MRIGIDKGHPLNQGAVKYLNETTENRKIGNRVIDKLKALGHTVFDCSTDYNSGNELGDRVRLANKQPLDLYVSIHLNSGGGIGTETFTMIGGSASTKAIAKRVNDAIVNSCNFRNRGVKEANYYVLRKTNAPAILIEACFVDSREDSNKLDCEKVANAIVKGITGQEVGAPKLNYNYIALEECSIDDGNGKTTGALWVGERCEERWITGDFRMYVRYLNSTKTDWKEGLVEKDKTSKVIPIVDAYNAYNSYGDTINVSRNKEFKGDVLGVVYNDEKLLKLSEPNQYGNVKVAFDSSYDGKLGRIGYVPAKCISLIEESEEEAKPVDPTEEENKVIYKVQVGAYLKKENADVMLNNLKAKGIDGYIKQE